MEHARRLSTAGTKRDASGIACRATLYKLPDRESVHEVHRRIDGLAFLA